MTQKELTIRYTETDNPVNLEPTDRLLLDQAVKAAKSAYAPYSGFRVGAAVLLEDGTVVTGNNQENAAYPSGLCAERVAIFSASAAHPGAVIRGIAVTVDTDGGRVTDPVPPCGACRQVIAEYESKQKKKIRITFAGETGRVVQVDGIDCLLPMTFNSNNLQHR